MNQFLFAASHLSSGPGFSSSPITRSKNNRFLFFITASKTYQLAQAVDAVEGVPIGTHLPVALRLVDGAAHEDKAEADSRVKFVLFILFMQ